MVVAVDLVKRKEKKNYNKSHDNGYKITILAHGPEVIKS